MAEVDRAPITLTAYDWVPGFAQGQVRDFRVRWALEEVGQDYRVHYLRQGEQKDAAHRRRSPFGQVPTYEQGELVLFESGAIAWHIATHFSGLLPGDAHRRERALVWVIAALNSVEPEIMDLVQATLFEADEPWSAPRVPAIETRVRARLRDLSVRLGEREWLEDVFSVGDLMMVAVLRISEAESLLREYPNLVAYRDRAAARPAFRRALASQLAGFTGQPPG